MTVSNQSVRRLKLLERINKITFPKIILINAPAGYGKTTLAQQLAAVVQRPVVWQSLDEWQSDIPNLHRQSVQTWGKLLPGIEQSVTVAKDAKVSALGITNYLKTYLTESCLYILDDVQHIADHSLAEDWLQTLVDTMPQMVCLVLVGRSVPAIRWSNLVAKGQVLAYGIEDLRFSVEEVQELAALSTDEAQSLVGRLGGWIAGIRLAVDKSTQTLTRLTLGVGEPETVLFNQLATEMFTQQPVDLQEMLLKTSTLRHFNPILCEAIGLSDITPFIETVVQRNLFVVHSNRDYSYHDLFRSFLQQRFFEWDVETFRRLHQQAAIWYRQANQMDEALWHFVTAQNFEAAIELAEIVVKEFFIYGQWDTLLLFEQLLDKQLVPRLSLYCAMIHTDRNDFERSTLCLQRAKAGFTKQQNTQGLLNAQMHTAYNYQRQGHYEDALYTVQSVIQTEAISPAIRGWAYRLQGEIYVNQGLYQEAIVVSRCALTFFPESDQIHERSHILQDLGEAYLRSGNFDEAGRIFQEMVGLRRKLNNHDDVALALNTLGYFYHCCSQYSDALNTLQEGLDLVGNLQSRATPYLYWSYGDVLRDMGQYSEAESVYEKAAKTAPPGDEHLYFGILLSVARMRIWQNRLTDAQEWITRVIKRATATDTIPLIAARIIEQLLYQLGGKTGLQVELATSIDKLVERRAYLKVAQLLGLYWFVGLRSSNPQLQLHAQNLLRQIGEQIYQPVAAELVNLAFYNELEPHRENFPALFLQVDILAQQHDKMSATSSVNDSQQLRLVTLGQQHISLNRVQIPDNAWTIAFAQELFLYLYFKGKQRKNAIALAFWSDHSTQQIRMLFHDTLKRVRKAVPKAIVHWQGYYMVNPKVVITCDAHEFRDLVRRARHLPPHSVRAEDLYRRAMELYGGDFLPLVFNDWARPLRDELQDLYMEALIGLGHCMEARADLPAAAAVYETAFALRPEYELITQHLMKAHAANQQLSDVQKVYERLKQYLHTELGVSPSTETDNLLKHLMD
jgi:ATP/maltotriose-dependent transcriptional regulator MalT/DNA-binding SARP family transcriptional activator